MKLPKTLLAATAALASLALMACGGATEAEDGEIATTQQAVGKQGCHGSLSSNALSSNALSSNALTSNALSSNALTSNALSSNALSSNALSSNALTDPDAREVLGYIVSCALPADETVNVTVNGVAYSYPGQLGLAPQWGDPHGQCDKDCQGWVSACLLARVDFLGVHREISLRGQNPGLAACDPEEDTYTVREATYYGNVFASPEKRFACLSPGQTEIARVCGPSLNGCVVNVDPEVTCKDVCDHASPDGAFPNCQPGDGDWDDKVYHQSITVYLEPGEV